MKGRVVESREIHQQLVHALCGIESTSNSKLDTSRIIHLFSRLKKIYRDCNVEKVHLDRTLYEHKKLRQELYLYMQNISFEKCHLKNELDLIHETNPMIYPKGLISIEDFLEANQNEGMDVDGENDRFRLEMERLIFEIEERNRLVRSLEEMRQSNSILKQANENDANYINNLHSKIAELLKYSTEIKNGLDIPVVQHDQVLLMHDFPTPLYCLYCMISTYSKIFDTSVSVSIRKTDNIGSQNQSMSKQTIILTLDSEVDIGFSYYENLDLVTVKAMSCISDDQLVALYPEDVGFVLPNYINRIIEVNELSLDGRPYKWAQGLCGLSDYAEPVLLSEFIPILRKRINHMKSFMTQISPLLGKSMYSSQLKRLFFEIFPNGTKSKISNFTLSSYKEFNQGDTNIENAVYELSWVPSSSYMYYNAQLDYLNNVSKLYVLIQAPFDFPNQHPKFRAYRKSSPSEYPDHIKGFINPESSDFIKEFSDRHYIKDIEVSLSTMDKELFEKSQNLYGVYFSILLMKLQNLFDTYLEQGFD